MDKLLANALDAINLRRNASTGPFNPNDRNAANEMFLRLSLAGETLIAEEIEAWAQRHGWTPMDAKELSALAQQICMGYEPLITDSPEWNENIIDSLSLPH